MKLCRRQDVEFIHSGIYTDVNGKDRILFGLASGHAVLRYTYHPDGSVKTMTDGRGWVLSYGYDHGGRLTSVADEVGEIVSYRHTPRGKVKEIRHRNGVRTAYEYDMEGNLIRLLTKTGNGETVCDLQYAYDRNGNRTAKAGTMTLPDHSRGLSAQIRDIRYRYDRMDRLAAEIREGEETSCLYDLCGNRLEKRKGEETERYFRPEKPDGQTGSRGRSLELYL